MCEEYIRVCEKEAGVVEFEIQRDIVANRGYFLTI